MRGDQGAEHEENAKLFVDFIVSPDVQRLAVEKLYRRTVRDDITPDQKEEGSIMDFDLGWAVKTRNPFWKDGRRSWQETEVDHEELYPEIFPA